MIPTVATSEEVFSQAKRFASGLANHDFAPETPVMIVMEQTFRSIALVWAALGLRLIPVPVSASLTTYELDVLIAKTHPGLVIRDASDMDLLTQHGELDFDPLPRCRPMHLTSGTTGAPKAIWSGFWNEEQAHFAYEEERELWDLSPQDTHLVVSGLAHSAPLRFALNTVLAGGRLWVPPRFDLEYIRHHSAQYRPTTMFCVPTHLRRILAAVSSDSDFDLSSFRLVALAGAPCPPELKREAIELFGADVLTEFYGSTEGQFTICQSTDWLERGAGVGFPRSNRRMFTDDDGVLWCEVPPWAYFEYLGDPALTATAWQDTTHSRAFTVGDLGRIDPDGWVHIDARRTDLIISGGVNVYPQEVENLLRRQAGVDDCAVIGRPHPDWGQEVVAVFTGTAQVENLRAAARNELSPAKTPKEFIRVQSIPHTSTGKIQRRMLQEHLRKND